MVAGHLRFRLSVCLDIIFFSFSLFFLSGFLVLRLYAVSCGCYINIWGVSLF
jgi:hypothetical protein